LAHARHSPFTRRVQCHPVAKLNLLPSSWMCPRVIFHMVLRVMAYSGQIVVNDHFFSFFFSLLPNKMHDCPLCFGFLILVLILLIFYFIRIPFIDFFFQLSPSITISHMFFSFLFLLILVLILLIFYFILIPFIDFFFKLVIQLQFLICFFHFGSSSFVF